jgi:hypothetical protein
MVYDSRLGRVVVVGGSISSAFPLLIPISFTWNGERWMSDDIEYGGPSSRLGASASYDREQGWLFVFGGSTPYCGTSECWSLDRAGTLAR